MRSVLLPQPRQDVRPQLYLYHLIPRQQNCRTTTRHRVVILNHLTRFRGNPIIPYHPIRSFQRVVVVYTILISQNRLREPLILVESTYHSTVSFLSTMNSLEEAELGESRVSMPAAQPHETTLPSVSMSQAESPDNVVHSSRLSSMLQSVVSVLKQSTTAPNSGSGTTPIFGNGYEGQTMMSTTRSRISG